MTPEAFESLSDEIKEMFNENSRKLKHIIEGTLYKSRKVEREYKEKLGELDKYAALFTVGAIFDEVKSKYEGNLNVVRYLDQVKSDMLNNLTNLRSENEETRSAYKRRYSVNVVVDNSELTGAPVVYERNPTYSNLVGKVEYQSRAGMLFTDFTLIRAGALHKANGGFLILDAEHLLRNPYSWECLKRALLSEEITVENLESVLGVSNIISLRPQPIPFSAKVVLISTPRIYYLLYTLDEDFRKLLKKYKFVQSMSGKGNCYDNAVAESFFKTLKTELIYHIRYLTRAQARASIFEYIEVFYNRVKAHSLLDGRSPVDFEKLHQVV